MTGLVRRSLARRLPRNSTRAAHKQSFSRARQSASTYELAYGARIAVERIRFSIRQIDAIAANQPVLEEVGMQLLDALDRLETAERHFQECFRPDPPRLQQLNARGGATEMARNQSRGHQEHGFSRSS